MELKKTNEKFGISKPLTEGSVKGNIKPANTSSLQASPPPPSRPKLKLSR